MINWREVVRQARDCPGCRFYRRALVLVLVLLGIGWAVGWF